MVSVNSNRYENNSELKLQNPDYECSSQEGLHPGDGTRTGPS